MLGCCKVQSRACLTMVVQKVLDVLSKYPQDKLSAFGCLQRVGLKHPDLCMSLTPQLIQDHPFFDSAEKDVEDPACKHNSFYLRHNLFSNYHSRCLRVDSIVQCIKEFTANAELVPRYNPKTLRLFA